jgi:hypothetical protein
MAVTIGGVTFDRDPVWTDRQSRDEVPATVYHGLEGTENVVEGAWGGEFPITLEATEKWGRISESKVNQLREMARVRGGVWTLDINGEEHQVRFRNEQRGGAIQMKQLWPTSKSKDDTVYIGKVYLMRVG